MVVPLAKWILGTQRTQYLLPLTSVTGFFVVALASRYHLISVENNMEDKLDTTILQEKP